MASFSFKRNFGKKNSAFCLCIVCFSLEVLRGVRAKSISISISEEDGNEGGVGGSSSLSSEQMEGSKAKAGGGGGGGEEFSMSVSSDELRELNRLIGEKQEQQQQEQQVQEQEKQQQQQQQQQQIQGDEEVLMVSQHLIQPMQVAKAAPQPTASTGTISTCGSSTVASEAPMIMKAFPTPVPKAAAAPPVTPAPTPETLPPAPETPAPAPKTPAPAPQAQPSMVPVETLPSPPPLPPPSLPPPPPSPLPPPPPPSSPSPPSAALLPPSTTIAPIVAKQAEKDEDAFYRNYYRLQQGKFQANALVPPKVAPPDAKGVEDTGAREERDADKEDVVEDVSVVVPVATNDTLLIGGGALAEGVTVNVNISVKQPPASSFLESAKQGGAGSVAGAPALRARPPPSPATVMGVLAANSNRGLRTFNFLLEKYCLLSQLDIEEREFTVFAPSDRALELEDSCLLLEVDVGRPLMGSLIVADKVDLPTRDGQQVQVGRGN